MTGILRLFRRNKWPVIIPIYDGRQCPDCGAIVCGAHGQRTHDAWHDWLADLMPSDVDIPQAIEEKEDPGGFIVGSGPLPEEIVRSDEEEREQNARR